LGRGIGTIFGEDGQMRYRLLGAQAEITLRRYIEELLAGV
jgi:hypothetical protein